MDRGQLHRLDLNLLLAFDALIAERNVTRAAERMSAGRLAMSASLARLRKFSGDPLLVRRGRVLVPTARALDLIGPIREALDTIESTPRQPGVRPAHPSPDVHGHGQRLRAAAPARPPARRT
jgi:DNA-binding transcriptional LysR family regulator